MHALAAPARMPSESLYLICKHSRFKLYCDDCLQERILEQACAQQAHDAQLGANFLAFAMGTHPRLGGLAQPPEVTTTVDTVVHGKRTIVTAQTVVESKHCACAALASDVLQKIWTIYVRDDDGVQKQVAQQRAKFLERRSNL
jgi:hypothetical protein